MPRILLLTGAILLMVESRGAKSQIEDEDEDENEDDSLMRIFQRARAGEECVEPRR